MRPEMTASNAVPGFLPSVAGLHFANRYAPGPTVRFGIVDPRWIGVGDAASGLCGGMSWLVREQFQAGQPIPADRVTPPNGSPLFRSIVRRQVLSLDWFRGPLRFWWMGLRGADAALRRTREAEVPEIRATIDGGRLAMVGLVRHDGWNPWHLTDSHVVLAYAYTAEDPTGSTTLQLYDPNWPDRDDVTVTLDATGLRQSTGEPLEGILALG